MNKKLASLFLFFILFLPVIVSAEVPKGPEAPFTGLSLNIVVDNIVSNVKSAIWIIGSTIVVVMFVLAGFKYLTAQGEPGKISDANKTVTWGLVGVVVMILAWSIVELVWVTLV